MRAHLLGLVRGRELATAVAVAAATGLLLTVLPALDRLFLLLASAGLLVVAGALGTWLLREHRAVEWTTSAGTPGRIRGSDRRVTALTRTVDAAVAGDPAAALQLQGTLRSLAQARLAQLGLPPVGAGVGGDHVGGDDDEAVRAALGPELTAYLHTSPPARVREDQLASFITILEEH